MKLVLDSSVGVKWVLIEALTDKAWLLRDDFRNGVIQLLAPDFFPLEVLHALTKAERQKRINPTEASTFWLDIMTTCPILRAALPLTSPGLCHRYQGKDRRLRLPLRRPR
jgi:predicted nucleic acid-binding protein